MHIKLAALLASTLIAASANAATITWDAAATNTDYNAPTQVSTAGTFVDSFSYNATTPGYTVNGVAFHPYLTTVASIASFSGATITVDFGGNALYAPNEYTNLASPPDPNTPPDYASATEYTIFEIGSNTMHINLPGLTPGQTYQVQLWNAPAPSYDPLVYSSSTDFTPGDSGVSPVLSSIGGSYTDSSGTYNTGQYITGTFVADGTDQAVYFNGDGYGYSIPGSGQLRLLETSTPEPGTLAIFALGAMGMLYRRRAKAALA